jgi:hypothetical protein
MRPLAVVALAALALALPARSDEEKVPLDKVPKPVLEAAKKRFPKAEAKEASKEEENGKTVFEITFKQDGKNIDVTLTPEGTITLIEKEVAFKELPKAVAETLDKKYPKAKYEIIEEVISVKDGKETLDYYEAHLTTADGKTMEAEVLPDGKLKGESEVKDEKKEEKKDGGFTADFAADKGDLGPTGMNPYFPLEPGYQLVLEGGKEQIVITVLNETRRVDGVECRVVEERETKDGKLVEVSRNFFAVSRRTNNVYYFGEDVDIYKDGKVVGHEGAWLSGKDGARFGLMMPGMPLLGARYQQEVAPKVAMDRAEIVSVRDTVKTPAGEFKNCVKTEDTTPLEKGNKEYKQYAPGIGQVTEGDLKLVRYGRVELPKK